MRKHDFIPTALVLIIGLLTFGIGNMFFVYYFSDIASKDRNGNVIIPMKEFILNIITFGIYGIFWTYKISSLIDAAEERRISPQTVFATVISALPFRFISMTIISVRLTGDTVTE